MQVGRKAVWNIPYITVSAYRSSKVSSHPDCIFEIHNCDDQALVECIPIPTVAVHLNLKSWKLVSHLIMAYWIFKSLR